MRATITLTDDGQPIDLIDLHSWLQRTPSVKANTQVQLKTIDQKGAMSAGDAIQIVYGSVAALASVVSAYAAWRSSRASTPSIIIVLDNGKSVIVRHGATAEITPLLEEGGPAATPGEDDLGADEDEPVL